MKYKKLMAKYFAYKSNDTTNVAVAVVAGLAVGAIISILFAPKRGADTRENIANKTKDLGNGIRDSYSSLKDRLMGAVEEVTEVEVPNLVQKTTKKRKSDVKDIIHNAHTDEHHNDQPIS